MYVFDPDTFTGNQNYAFVIIFNIDVQYYYENIIKT
jgi:hypothetical protein